LSSDSMTGHTYLVADPEPLTLGEMIAVMRSAAGRRPNLVPMPPAVVTAAAHFMGLVDAAARIEGSLVVDPARLLRAGWKPALSSREALAETVRAILANSS